MRTKKQIEEILRAAKKALKLIEKDFGVIKNFKVEIDGKEHIIK